MSAKHERRKSGHRCPICGKPGMQQLRPFCSRRCADVDLARWLGGANVVAGGDTDADEDGEAAGNAAPSPERRPENDGSETA